MPDLNKSGIFNFKRVYKLIDLPFKNNKLNTIYNKKGQKKVFETPARPGKIVLLLKKILLNQERSIFKIF